MTGGARRAGRGDVAAARPRRVLVVDDSRMQRRILAAQIAGAGYEVVEAGSGAEALALCAREPPDLILSDWMMPGMSGLDFCRAFRAMPRDSYGYFILLTSKTEKGKVAQGLDVGADDFLTKPVAGDELRARLAAGERILRMERELKDKNRLLLSTLGELQRLYDSLDRDLTEAQKLQQSLVRERQRSFATADVSLLLRQAGRVGGDLVGFFAINPRRVGLYAIDVSGHGITSALMTARLAGYLSGAAPEQNIALVPAGPGLYEGRPPAELAAHLNRQMLKGMRTESYFTMLYADVDLVTGRVAMVQAGHPHPLVQRAGGQVEWFGLGGLPVGLVADARFDAFELTLAPGDRLLMVSDGLTEAGDAQGRLLTEEGLAAIMRRQMALVGPDFLAALEAEVTDYASGGLADDVSAVLLEFRGGAPARPRASRAARTRKCRSPSLPTSRAASASGSQTALCPGSEGGPSRRTGRAR